jgi:hypothetical protein
MRLRPLAFLACLLLIPAAVSADLKWDKTTQEVLRTRDEGAFETRFTFRNTGESPVTIRLLRASCGCTTARLEKKTYAPGEQGEIPVRFVFGDRKGLHHVSVNVFTAEHPDQPTLLNLFIDIRDPVAIEPAFVYWRTGEAAAAKTVQVSATPGQPVHVTGVSSSNPRVTAALETVKPGAKYIVSATPADTSKKEAAEITIQTDFPPDSPKAYKFRAMVK